MPSAAGRFHGTTDARRTRPRRSKDGARRPRALVILAVGVAVTVPAQFWGSPAFGLAGNSPSLHCGRQSRAPRAAQTREELQQCSVIELKERLSSQGLKVSGKKKQLIERLLASIAEPAAADVPAAAEPAAADVPAAAEPAAAAPPDYTSWSAEQLREECKKRGLPFVGKPAWLCQRLDKDDQAAGRSVAQDEGEVSVVAPQTEFAAGDQVLAVWHEDQEWYPAKVLKKNDDGTFQLEFEEDGSEGGDPVNANSIRLLKHGNTGLAPQAKYRVGDSVLAYWPDEKRWYSAIIQLDKKSKYMISWDEDGIEFDVKPDMLRPLWPIGGYRVGDPVLAQQDNKWYPAKVKADKGERGFIVTWDVPGEEWNGHEYVCKASQMRLLKTGNPQFPVYRRGNQIIAQYKEDEPYPKWYTARVRKVKSDGTLHIKWLDDGYDYEATPETVRLWRDKEPPPPPPPPPPSLNRGPWRTRHLRGGY